MKNIFIASFIMLLFCIFISSYKKIYIIKNSVRYDNYKYLYNYKNIKEERVTVTYYSSDCKGCIGITKSGYDVNKTIYYNDSEYGNVRVCAADKKYPLGTIIDLDGIITIILDRGSKICDSCNSQIDLLVNSSSDAIKLGINRNVPLKVLREGY